VFSVRELGNRGRSRVDTLRQLGIRPTVVPVSNVNDGINAVRQILDQAWIDETHCARGLNALREYRREWSEKNKAYADKPKHDWTSHACDALRTFCCGYRDRVDKAVMPSSSWSVCRSMTLAAAGEAVEVAATRSTLERVG
jgi:phage terminase large subunit